VSDYRDRNRRDTLRNLSPAARALWDELGRDDLSRDELHRLRRRMPLLPQHQQRYVLRLWRYHLDEVSELAQIAAALHWVRAAVEDFLAANDGPVPAELRARMAAAGLRGLR
jgi:hypothetical protein